MKHEKNNEIDLLLRSLVKGKRGEAALGGGLVSRSEDEALSEHLDADELNSFAEGVVPAAARVRYQTHLADCGSCRAIAINLSRASGGVGSRNPEPQTQTGFWRTVTSFFSPPVLRYAIPALALTAVIAISLLALRSQRKAELVAQSGPSSNFGSVPTQEQTPETSITQSRAETPGTQTKEATQKNPIAGAPRSTSDLKEENKPIPTEKEVDSPVAVGTPDSVAPFIASTKDSSPAKGGYAAKAPERVFAQEPQTAQPAAAPKPVLSDNDKLAALRKTEVTQSGIQTGTRSEAKEQPRDERGRHGPSRSSTPSAGSKRDDGLINEREEERAKSKDGSDDEGETRTISGKRFRRRGDVWIDSSYDSSRRTINVSRGSDQFRALVADEPAIGTISERLNGVIILVWNGRVYRIQ